MGSDTSQALNSGNYPKKSSDYDEIYMQENLKFADSLMDLKNLREQLYSAPEYFESSYDKDEHKEFIVESSKDYVSKAIVSTVDHLGSIADKLNKFLEEKADEFSEIKIRFSCVEQKLNTIHRFVDLREMSKQILLINAQKHQKRYIIPAYGTSQFDKSNIFWKNCTSCPKTDMQEATQGKEDLVQDHARMLHCSHLFHTDCRDSWFMTHDSCPVCGYKMSIMPKMKNTSRQKRKSIDMEESECRSDGTASNKSSQKSGTTRKSRVAEVHNLSEGRRRDRINDKMKALQELIPHSNKIVKVIQKQDWYASDVYLFKDLIVALARRKKMDDAMALWECMRKENLFPDCQTYTEVIRGFLQYGSPSEAMNIYEDMKKSPDPPEQLPFRISLKGLLPHPLLRNTAKQDFEEFFPDQHIYDPPEEIFGLR